MVSGQDQQVGNYVCLLNLLNSDESPETLSSEVARFGTIIRVHRSKVKRVLAAAGDAANTPGG